MDMRIVYRDPNDLKPDPRNSRTHSPEQIEQLRASYRQFGWTNPVLLKGDDETVGAGNARREMAILEKIDAIPTITLDGLSEDEWRAYAIADNRLPENAGWDEEMLRAELEHLRSIEFDLPTLGFDDEDQIAEILGISTEGPGRAKKVGNLADEFLIPPFSVLNAREGIWQERKRGWIALGIESELGRGENLLRMSDTMLEPDPEKRKALKGKARTFGQDLMRGEHVVGEKKSDTRATKTQDWVQKKIEEGEISGGLAANHSGTSIFDPVLCELSYRWFCPPGGQILDPFAGGSVRGIVAAALGRKYTGVDLRPEQCEANRAQWPIVAERLGEKGPADEVPELRVDDIDGLRVVRDDRVLGGTKRRVLDLFLTQSESDEFVYATPAYGFAQIALAYAARAAGKKATIFVAGRKRMHPRTRLAVDAGANVIEIEKGGYLKNIQKKAEDYAKAEGAYLMPFGLDSEEIIESLADLARSIDDPPSEVWSVAGSGTLIRALQRAWPDAKFHAVQIGRKPEVGDAQLWKAPEKFEADAKEPPPFPSCSNYDAKAWRFVREHASPGALFWNVGADPQPQMGGPDPEWIAGDSRTDQPDIAADFVFSCPPYGDLEIYSDDPHDLSLMEDDEFLAAYREIIAASVERLRNDRFAAFVVGDYRDKRGMYRDFVSRTIAAFRDAGMELYNEAILVTAAGSLAMRAGKQFRATRKFGKAHQNVLVFVKGDPRKATEACGPVDIEGALELFEAGDDQETD